MRLWSNAKLMQQTISVRGARENNLRNIDVEIPRDCLVVVTGLSGSGKSSLAFDTVFAEGQRKFLESMSLFAKRYIQQLKKPEVDFVFGLSPVISIEQKTLTKNPRSTVGTMTDIYDYMRILFATIGEAHCPYTGDPAPIRTAEQIAERILALPQGTAVELLAPVFKIYGEDYPFLLADIRTRGHRKMRIDGELVDISNELNLDEGVVYDMDVVVDRFYVKPDIHKYLLNAIGHGLKIGEGFLRFHVTPASSTARETGDLDAIVMGELLPFYFSFNEGDSACVTCGGLGVYLQAHPDLIVPDKSRTILSGAFIPEAFKYDKNSWAGRIMYSLAEHYCFRLDVPFKDLPKHVVEILFYGTKGEKFELLLPEGATKGDQHIGKHFRFDGILNQIERRYRHYRKEKVAHTWMEEYLKKVMVEHTCPDCNGTKLKRQRLLVTVNGRTIHELGNLPLPELKTFLLNLPVAPRQHEAGQQVVRELVARLDLLIGIGLDYLHINRKSMTLAGGEAQRIRLATQIGSGLMGMLYVLDEPSIGLHPKDNVKMIRTLQRLRDIGNTVIVVEHDEETIRSADHVIEVGPGPGIHGGQIVAQGTLQDLLNRPDSLTGTYLSGRRRIEVPGERRAGNGHKLVVRGARENNLRNIDVEFPLGLLVCVTGASGSGKSSLVNEILYKRLFNHFHDSRVLSGAHDGIEGMEYLHDVINIDQSPIGRSPRSNPATYIGFYDDIRRLFAAQPESLRRGYTPSRFSFNVKGGRCEECGGEGIVHVNLHFMPEMENACPTCRGKRYNEETLEVEYKGKSIADVLDLSVEASVEFFSEQSLVAHKLGIMADLGLGYLTLGQAATTLSGGEAQRVKLATELGKIKRGGKNLYILDEPTTGLHLADIQRLLDSLNRLVDAGNSVLVIEHHLDVIKTADWIIDLGPEGGNGGGKLLVTGTPETVAACPHSHTGRFLRPLLA